jgi:D-glycero-alpha-D-manno-heptose-7-phosphate kinase
MIISQTPYRVSFAGGGTDLPAFFTQEPGAVLSTAIASYVYVTIHNRFTDDVRVAYSQIEVVDDPRLLQHGLVREAILLTGLQQPLEITTIGDVPGGTGMGSSSAVTVGLLNSLYAYQGRIATRHQLAEDACRIEIEQLSKPIGKQDQYASAFGGINYLEFYPDGSVLVEPIPILPKLLGEFERRFLLFYIGQRSADVILAEQSKNTKSRIPVLRNMREIAKSMRQSLLDQQDLDQFAALLHESWIQKRSLGFGIANTQIDEMYQIARQAGAQGGKLLGAGGSGFLLLMAPANYHESIRTALKRPKELPFRVDRLGSRIIFVSEQR